MVIKDLDQRPWAPPSLNGALIFPGYDGGAGWGGSAYDPGRHRLILNAQETAGILRLLEIPAGFSDRDEFIKNCARCHGVDRKGLYPDRAERYGAGGPNLIDVGERLSVSDIRSILLMGRGTMPQFAHLSELEGQAIVRHLLAAPTNPEEDSRTTEITYAHAGYLKIQDQDGLPGNSPPWGTLTAIDLATGQASWQVALGNYPSHPELGFGAENAGGAVVTASGLIFTAATPDMKIRAYDTRNGKMLWQAELPAAGYSTPAIYSVAGRQYVVIAAGGGHLGPPSGSEYVAFALPD